MPPHDLPYLPDLPELRLRPLGPGDEAAARAAQRELAAEGFEFLFGLDPGRTWSAFLDGLDRGRLGIDLPPGRVADTVLAAEVDGGLVGRVAVRHELNEVLANTGGHIGYAVRPAFRRRGYATAMLTRALVVASGLGIADALLTCAVANAASARTIERCGGVPDGVVLNPLGVPTRRYWIPTAGR